MHASSLKLLQRRLQRFDGALNICLDDDIQVLGLALADLVKQVVQKTLDMFFN